MLLGIDLMVDFAFKKTLGSYGSEPWLLDLLEAILEEPFAGVEILNPFDPKDFADDKLAILDVKARTADRRFVNVEMQIDVPPYYPERGVFYASGMIHTQLREGEGYELLRPAIGIHFLNGVLFPDEPRHHLTFELRARQRPDLRFSDLLRLDTIELPKFHRRVNQLRTPKDRWLWLLRHSARLNPANLPAGLDSPIMRQVVEALRVMAQTPVERERYEARVKAQRDFTSGIQYARREGERLGIAKGEQLGIAKGERNALWEALLWGTNLKFGSAGANLLPSAAAQSDAVRLRALLADLQAAATLDELRRRWQ